MNNNNNNNNEIAVISGTPAPPPPPPPPPDHWFHPEPPPPPAPPPTYHNHGNFQNDAEEEEEDAFIMTRIVDGSSHNDDDDDDDDHNNNHVEDTHRPNPSHSGWCCCCCRCCASWWSQLRCRHLASLSRASTTPGWATLLVPILSVMAHFIFIYGQTAPMWRLHLSEQVNVWANASTYTAQSAAHALGLPYENHWEKHQEHTVRSFTYTYAIHELWKARHMPGSKSLPRAAAVLLVLFSGVWPHLKLLLLNGTWLFATQRVRRTRTLQALSTLGKWSLADVLVVCVMVGVLNLDWVVDPETIKRGIIDHVPVLMQAASQLYSAADVCSMALKPLDCHIHHESWKKWAQCKACLETVSSALDHPHQARQVLEPILDGVHVSGGGLVYLRVFGMRGIYAFCVAVVLSIWISLFVDILDVRAHDTAALASQTRAAETELQFAAPNRVGMLDCDEEQEEEGEGDQQQQPQEQQQHLDQNPDFHRQQRQQNLALIMGRSERNSPNLDDAVALNPSPRPFSLSVPNQTMGSSQLRANYAHQDEEGEGDLWEESTIDLYWSAAASCRYYCTIVTSIGTAVIVWAAIRCNTMERLVYGAIPDLLHQVLAVQWERQFSLWSLVRTTGAAGGWDYLFMSTFGGFIVLGPAFRALLCVAASGLPAWLGRTRLLTLMDLMGAFCAWEVFVVALVMVQVLMPAITSTVLMRSECAAISPDTGNSCLEVEFNILEHTFGLILVGGLLLLLLSNCVFGVRRRRKFTSVSAGAAAAAAGNIATTVSIGGQPLLLVAGGGGSATASTRYRLLTDDSMENWEQHEQRQHGQQQRQGQQPLPRSIHR